MDYAGLDVRNIRYPINRPLTEEERENEFSRATRLDIEPNNYLSIIKCNSTFMELVDRWYSIKGFNVWLGAMTGAILLWLVSLVMWAMLFDTGKLDPDEWWVPWVGWGVLIPMGLFFLSGSVWLVRSECFRWTHYPMRLNRKTRQVHVFRQDGTVLTTPWDDLFIVLANSTTPPIGKTFDLRAHVLAEDRQTVLESFSLGYVLTGDEDSTRKLWEFIRRYMEEPDGVGQAFEQLGPLDPCLPLDGRKEGWGWGIFRTLATSIHWPLLQLVSSLVFSWVALGRGVAMITSKQPQWPAEVEAANAVEPNDPYQRNWRGNPPLTAWQKYWTAFCFVAGIIGSSWILWWVIRSASE
ncbi:DUF6708 domain-containing protein [Lysobacter cavernae]|uniref:DUF6708 domain-containing protein n=1 Tax=Lysobacter cavernae TaxID=1685901 RepID=A0ABV7RUQ2_9GAMM